MTHNITDPNLNRVAWNVNRHKDNPEVTDELTQTIARIVGYDTGNKLYRFLRCDNEGDLIVSSSSFVSNLGYVDKINVPTSSTEIAPTNYNRKQINIRNNGANNLYIAFNSDATVADGYLLKPDEVWESDHFTGQVTAISDGGTNDVRVLVIN